MAMNPPNSMFKGRNKGHSSTPVPKIEGRGAMPPDHRFNVDTARMPQPPAAVEPGTGMIPVGPWNSQGGPARAKGKIPDDSTLKIPRR